MASMQQGTGGNLTTGVFESVQHAANAIDGLLNVGLAPDVLGAVMSDRTAERHFGPANGRQELGAAGTFGANVNRVAASLIPMAALGTPGAGLVATGPLAAALVGAGLGSRCGLEHALAQLGVKLDEAREVARRVKNGAVLVSVPAEDGAGPARFDAPMQSDSSMTFQLHLKRPLSNTTVVTRPRAPAISERARYEPVVETSDADGGGRAGAKSS
jgi:hypothetical protein